MSLQTDTKVTALYLRLSSDDGNEGDSDSILNQRTMLTKYANDNGFTDIMEFTDDGYSGGNFDRPGFKRMLAMVENNEIGTVIVKDLSRLGREYIQMGLYTEMVFPKHNVGFIAINDSVDSRKGENDFAAFKNLFNEYFIRDTSRKIRAVKDMQAKNGIRVCGKLAPYGYVSDGEKLSIDEPAAEVVRHIFTLCKEGNGPSRIARLLNEDNIPSPSAYRGWKGYQDSQWVMSMVSRVLGSKEYLGHIVTRKSYSASYKTKRRIANAEADMLVFPDIHEPIIDAETFEICQKLREGKRRNIKMGEQPIYSGLIFCADCGSPGRVHRGRDREVSRYAYTCGAYRQRNRCTRHGIRVNVLEKLVLGHIRMMTGSIAESEMDFAEKLMKKSVNSHKSEIARKKRELEKAKRRAAEIDRLFAKLYEDRTLGSLPEERYRKMASAYEREQAGLNALIETSEFEVSTADDTAVSIGRFLKIARKHLDLQELDGTILRELVEKIVVHERKNVDGRISQQIDIHYNFVGVVEEAII